jgi:hypothetical protein
MKKREHLGLGFFEWQIILWLSIWLAISQQALGLRPIREKPRSWSDEVCVCVFTLLMIVRKFLHFDVSQKHIFMFCS